MLRFNPYVPLIMGMAFGIYLVVWSVYWLLRNGAREVHENIVIVYVAGPMTWVTLGFGIFFIILGFVLIHRALNRKGRFTFYEVNSKSPI